QRAQRRASMGDLLAERQLAIASELVDKGEETQAKEAVNDGDVAAAAAAAAVVPASTSGEDENWSSVNPVMRPEENVVVFQRKRARRLQHPPDSILARG
ncbi:hypothetical protein EDD11_004716, partial [Mortierella claussenii]